MGLSGPLILMLKGSGSLTCVYTQLVKHSAFMKYHLYQSAGLPEKNIIGVPCSTASRHLLAMGRPRVASLATRVTEQVILPQTDFQPA